MDRKLRHLLMFLLIILMVPNLQVAGWLWGSSEKADSNCTPSSAQNAGRSCAPPRCDCRALGLTSINVNLPTSFTELDLGHNKITMIQKGTFKNLPQLQILDLSKNQITMIQAVAFENLPQLLRLLLSYNQITMLQAAGIALIGTVILTIWCKRRTKNPLSGPSSGPNSNIALDNVAKSATLVTSGHDQTGQGQCQTITDDETIYVQPDGALYMKQEDVLYEMPADAGPRQPTEETSLAPSKRKSRLKDKPNSLPPPRGDDDCVYVVPDGAMYMTPEDVLYEMPTNSHHKQPIGTNENMHYYQPQTKDTALPTDADGYMIVAPKHMEGH
uniref:LRRNT domain-containing protein n=1 Tax=Branchiostoma floridae TaxID=7739 RepID=C3ZT66_BRAFL|eukprot:XP_002588261.1 hypothetical protein BRAFLDRAFT_86709 [Branchiostoma floridae]